MGKSRHHFVPRFYLRAFSSAPGRINIYNLASMRAIRDGDLRHQCYRKRFYGKTNELEEALVGMEGEAARVISSIVATEVLPRPNSVDHFTFLAFVAVQISRTTRAADRVSESTDKYWRTAMADDAELEGYDLDEIRISVSDPVLVSMQAAEPTLWALEGLKTHLLTTTGDRCFITSDNPVARYNQYCEEIKETAVLGPIRHGFQAFIPLSPRHLVVLYDGSVYKVGKPGRSVTRVTDEDVATLNLMQAVSADENLYFADWAEVEAVATLASRATRYRAEDRIAAEEFVSDTDPEHSSLVAVYERMPNLKLDLSFMGIRREARRMSLAERMTAFRKEWPAELTPPERPGAAMPRTERFRRREPHEKTR